MKEEALEIINGVLAKGRKSLVEYEAKQVLKAYGLPLPEEKLARSADEAIKYAEEIGYPVVLKLMSPQILHKSDARVVALKIKDADELRKKWEEIHENARKYRPDAEILGVLVAPMLKPGREVIIGVTEDPQFGHAVMFGLGGIFVEILKDVTFRIVPIEEKDAWAMIKNIKGYPILAGARGEEPADMKALVDMILKVSKLVDDLKDYLKEMDLNPVFVYNEGEGAMIVDARIILK
ncbi:MAG: acetate--CoA ligase family protein [Palaeococcus sp.]|uniref:acetate--CoA ligase family protein n=1 Tax=Palaeococcus sp. (in: euryarchaeotes) TaxID=2820298 RepID=UPI0025FD84C5|nr:acetate--CoA ligase family protein [Palaeococcus sp. (in: euryarchaeotes)]MCD6558365.1 acetate--CoA ligase family protein [Palaeococcus sp. (in: euryarchaeotes)]